MFRLQLPSEATVKQIELAQNSTMTIPGVELKRSEESTQRREGLLILFTLVAYGAAWVGSHLFFHVESLIFSLLGLALLVVAWLSWWLRDS